MTTISAKIVADSISPAGKRLTTMHCRYPLMVHAELMTHRVFSRNARSSRAVPVPKMIAEVMSDPVVPIHWGAAQRGMQAYEECRNGVSWTVEFDNGDTHQIQISRESAWLRARDAAVRSAQALHDAGYHKQNVNRLLAPFLHVDTLISATEWANWDALRDHHMAEPHIEALAKAMKTARAESDPVMLKPWQWHLPYVDTSEESEEWIRIEESSIPALRRSDVDLYKEVFIPLSVARCARISYAPFDGDASIEAELKRYDLLVGSAPLHASPTEHQATPDTFIDPRALKLQWARPDLHGNLVGWRQFRKLLPGEAGPSATPLAA